MDVTVCRHGGLRRKCETCDYEEERDALAAEILRLRKIIDGAAETGEIYERRLSDCEADNERLTARLAEAEGDRDAGWKAFYALREQVGRDRYPGLTNIVRTADSASGEGEK